jgi:hypothetical protein
VLAVTKGVSGAAAAAIVTGVANLAGLAYYGRAARDQLVQTESEQSNGKLGRDGEEHRDEPQSFDQIRNNDAPIAVEFG